MLASFAPVKQTEKVIKIERVENPSPIFVVIASSIKNLEFSTNLPFQAFI